MMIFSLVAMIGLDKCCITSACLQWLCHSGERIVARGPLVILYVSKPNKIQIYKKKSKDVPKTDQQFINMALLFLVLDFYYVFV